MKARRKNGKASPDTNVSRGAGRWPPALAARGTTILIEPPPEANVEHVVALMQKIRLMGFAPRVRVGGVDHSEGAIEKLCRNMVVRETKVALRTALGLLMASRSELRELLRRPK